METYKTGYKIFDPVTKTFSKGIVSKKSYDGKRPGSVSFTRKGGKEWTSEDLVRKHLVTCIENLCFLARWQVVEVQYVPKGNMEEWVGPKELLKVLKL